MFVTEHGFSKVFLMCEVYLNHASYVISVKLSFALLWISD